ncbi:hypothetical protein BMS3Bbin02_00938 [bacterium BMS3Bbin02]|nr:hypothetical protein BMS3Bbin02_00938 [bacterium BMS3Bbin02]
MTPLKRPIRIPGGFSKLWVVAVTVLTISAVACGEGAPDGGAVTSSTLPSTTRTTGTTTTVQSSATSDTVPTTTLPPPAVPATTTTTVADVSEHIPSKPTGEPEIELLPIPPNSFTAALERESEIAVFPEPFGRYFSFEKVSGYTSYAVASDYVWRSGGESQRAFQEGRVDGSFVYFALGGFSDELQEFLFSEKELAVDMEAWVRQEGEWTPTEDLTYALFLFEIIKMEAAHKVLFDTFDTLTFEDWELIDGVWYARYAASKEFIAATLRRTEQPILLTDSAGDVRVSPQGFLHSFEISATDPDQDVSFEVTWRLNNLGSTTVSFLDPPVEPGIPAAPEDSATVELLRGLLSAELWDPAVLFGGEPFRWRGRLFVDYVKLDASDGDDQNGFRDDRDSWGEVGSSEDDGLQRTVSVSVDNGDAFETAIVGAKWWERVGTVDEDGLFVSDGSDWRLLEVASTPGFSTSGLLATGENFYNNYATPTLVRIGPDEVDGVPVVRYRTTIEDGGDADFRFSAVFAFWVLSDVDGVRLVKLVFSGEGVFDFVTTGVVTATKTIVLDLEVYDVGDSTIEVNPP